MEEKFTYYDFIANIIPGFFLVWALNSISKEFIFGNVVTESLMFIILAYILGLAIQYFSKYSIEWLIKTLSWKGSLYSNIFLIKEAKLIPGSERKRYLKFVQNKFDFNKEDLEKLDTQDIFKKKNKEKLKEAKELSHCIYKVIDNYTLDKEIAKKAHIQNNYYSLFRGLALSFLFIGLLFAFLMFMSNTFRTTPYSIYFLFSLSLFVIFTIRTKERGESYIKGLFQSLR